MPVFDIRRTGVEDALVTLTMLRELAEHQGEAQHVTAQVEEWQRLIAREDVIVLLAEHNGEAAGYVSALRRPHLWRGIDILALDDLYVRPSYRNAGLGRSLMLALARLALPDQLSITWGVRRENTGAQRFYADLGANLSDKVVVAWDPAAYSELLSH